MEKQIPYTQHVILNWLVNNPGEHNPGHIGKSIHGDRIDWDVHFRRTSTALRPLYKMGFVGREKLHSRHSPNTFEYYASPTGREYIDKNGYKYSDINAGSMFDLSKCRDKEEGKCDTMHSYFLNEKSLKVVTIVFWEESKTYGAFLYTASKDGWEGEALAGSTPDLAGVLWGIKRTLEQISTLAKTLKWVEPRRK